MLRQKELLAIAAGSVGGAIAIAIMLWLAVATAFPLMTVPFATSIVVVMGSPDVDAARPRAVIGGHLLATLVGLVFVKTLGPSNWIAALAVGAAIAAMHATDTFHPPAGIDPILAVVYDMSWSFLAVPVGVGACLLAAFALGWHYLIHRWLLPRMRM